MENLKSQTLKIMELTQGNICDHCLGRLFYQEVSGENNSERGNYVKKLLNSAGHLTEKNAPCYLCGDIFDNLEETLEKIINRISSPPVEFSTFLVGCRLNQEILNKEKILQEEIGIESESIKKEINRELGKQLEALWEREVDFDNPNLVIMVDFTTDKINLQINPLFLEGRYRKLIRGIPQTRWPCKKCKGKGCERCNFTGGRTDSKGSS